MFKTTSFWSLLFIPAFLVLNASVFWFWRNTEAYERPAAWSSGGPVEELGAGRSSASGDVVYPGAPADTAENNVFLAEGTAVSGASDPLTNLIFLGDGLKKYKVRKGDTFQKIAANLGLSADALKKLNPGVKTIKQGDTIVVSPLEDKSAIQAVSVDGILPDLKDYFALPAIGWNWGQLHNANAVDIANQCGTSVHAAAEGLVISDSVLGDGASGWNNGYGTFVLLEHPNGVKTRYAHLDKVLVKIGQYVSRGEEVGIMGNTGNTHGPTGCHLHFEVFGAKNPFAVSK
ncbi:MAG: peptidoglycan DD-metalloendopeptidase family protein [Patescibacteria group bacterium]